jgi:hypothetical protein
MIDSKRYKLQEKEEEDVTSTGWPLGKNEDTGN